MDMKRALLQNKLIATMFVFSTAFFLFQHSTGLSWDFAAYAMNAKYMLGQGFYFEWFRAPLAQVLIAAFSPLGWLLAEYIYIFFSSALFLYSCVRLSGKLKINAALFYALMLNPFLLIAGMSVGTELLSLALLQLMISYSIGKNGPGMGACAGLLALVRYTNIIYFPLLLFSRRWKSVLLSAAIVAMLFMPWLLYNMVATGSPLTSIADSYALNVLCRKSTVMQFNMQDILVAANYLLPLLIAGLWVIRKRFSANDWLMVAVLLLALVSYYTIPLKDPRYAFNIILPCAYFATFALKSKKEKHICAVNFGALAALLALSLSVPMHYVTLENPADYNVSADDCMLASNAWVFYDYVSRPAEPVPLYDVELKNMVDSGYRVIIYKRIKDPDYVGNLTFLRQFPVLGENGYILIGNRSICMPKYAVNKTYIQRRNESVYAKYGYSAETDLFKVMFLGIC